jgi:hypothetical protein
LLLCLTSLEKSKTGRQEQCIEHVVSTRKRGEVRTQGFIVAMDEGGGLSTSGSSWPSVLKAMSRH